MGGDGDPARNGRGRLVGLRPLDRRLGAVLAVEDCADEAGFFPDCIQQIADETRDGHVTPRCLRAKAQDEGVIERDHRRSMTVAVAFWCVLARKREGSRAKTSITLSTGPKFRACTHKSGASNVGCWRESSHRPDSSAL